MDWDRIWSEVFGVGIPLVVLAMAWRVARWQVARTVHQKRPRAVVDYGWGLVACIGGSLLAYGYYEARPEPVLVSTVMHRDHITEEFRSDALLPQPIEQTTAFAIMLGVVNFTAIYVERRRDMEARKELSARIRALKVGEQSA
jgi:hypothetical protein